MKTQISKLENAIANYRQFGFAHNSRLRTALKDLRAEGFATTGFSTKGQKEIWTAQVVALCQQIGVKVESGNNAPRGGACGEFVKLASKAAQKTIIADKVAEAEAERAQIINYFEALKATPSMPKFKTLKNAYWTSRMMEQRDDILESMKGMPYNREFVAMYCDKVIESVKAYKIKINTKF